MNKLLLNCLAALLLLGALPLQAQMLLEDFETGDTTLSWEARNGSFDVVANPDSNRVNMSGFAGEYMRDSTQSYSQLRVNFPEGIDLGAAMQIAVDVLGGKDTRFILKLEGDPNREPIQTSFDIPVVNQWRRYTTNFTAEEVEGSAYTAMLFFFDYDNAGETAAGTYYVDNLSTEESDCTDVEIDPLVIDDFECSRTAIRAGFDSLFIVENPAPDDVNGAGLVGAFRDPSGPGTRFSALSYRYFLPIDLSVNSVVKLKYWSPIANTLLVKLEGGGQGAKEVDVVITEEQINQWVEVEVDFTDVNNKEFKQLTLFANARVEGAGETYYFDDIRFSEAPPVVETFVDDFESVETGLFWRPLNGDATQNGSFATIANPDVSGLNETATVGAYTTGNTATSTLTGTFVDAINLSVEPQINMLVWAPEGSTSVRLSAVSATQGRTDVTQAITATEEWIRVSFNFEAFAAVADVNSLQLLFDEGDATAGRVYYFDQLTQGASSVDVCEGTEPVANLIDDFECQRNETLVNGADRLVIIDNPDTDGNSSERVGQYTRLAGAGNEFVNISYEFTEPAGLDLFNRVSFDLWAPAIVPVLVKFEDSANGADNIEVPVTITEAMSWQTVSADFSAAAGGDFRKLIIFLNFNQVAATEDIYYIDNVELKRGPLTGCVADFETANTSFGAFNVFQNGTVDSAFSVINNPDPTGANTTSKVGRFREATGVPGAGVESFAGIGVNFEAPVLFPDAENKVIKILVWSPDETRFVVKLEKPGGEGGTTGDVFPESEYSTPGMWQELTFNYVDFDTDGLRYEQITIIPGFGEIPAANRDLYFDEIRIGDAVCDGDVSVRTPRADIANLQAFPNPASDQLTVVLPENAQSLRFVDAVGRTLLSEQLATGVSGDVRQISVANLPRGVYTVVALGTRGEVLARTRVSVAR